MGQGALKLKALRGGVALPLRAGAVEVVVSPIERASRARIARRIERGQGLGEQVFVDHTVGRPARSRLADDYGRTALHEAARYASPKYVLALLQAGSDTAAKDLGGMTPLQLSRTCLANPPDFVVADNEMKEYYEKHRTLYLADLKDVIDILYSWTESSCR